MRPVVIWNNADFKLVEFDQFENEAGVRDREGDIDERFNDRVESFTSIRGEKT